MIRVIFPTSVFIILMWSDCAQSAMIGGMGFEAKISVTAIRQLATASQNTPTPNFLSADTTSDMSHKSVSTKITSITSPLWASIQALVIKPPSQLLGLSDSKLLPRFFPDELLRPPQFPNE